MSYHAEMIAETIGSSDPATTGLVEELMRTEHRTLDAMTRAEFDHSARAALRCALELAHTGLLADFCDALQIPLPPVLPVPVLR